MGKGIILRIPKEPELTAEIFSALSKRLPGYSLERYTQTPDNQDSISCRIGSLYEAFLFILEAYPLDPKFTRITADTLKDYAAECKSACNLKKSTIEELHLELEKFTAKLVDALRNFWEWPSGSVAVKKAISCLNEAECYYLMMKCGRPDIATLSPFELDGEKVYILQYDESLTPHYPLLIEELTSIKSKNYPKTPLWLIQLSECQQAYFCNIQMDEITPKDVMQDLNEFIKLWDDIKNRSLNIAADLKQIQCNEAPFPLWFSELSSHRKEMMRVLAKKPEGVRQELSQLKKIVLEKTHDIEFINTLSLVPEIPHWYWCISHQQQSFLEYVLANTPSKEEALTYISSRHRTLPLPSNYGAHSLLKINSNGEIEELSAKRFRSSHVASRDALKFPDAVQRRHVDSNLEKVMEHAAPDAPRLMQTLISPIPLTDYLPTIVTNYLPEFPPDLELYTLARAAVARSERSAMIWQHNHPYNIAKRIYYTQANNPDSKSFLLIAQKYVDKFPEVETLITDYKNTLDSAMGSATFLDYDGRELFLSSLESLIILTIGGFSYGSCASGKDRKAIELLHTNAMILYKLKYGCWPKFGAPKENEDRIKFVNIFVDLYISRHQHKLAAQNAPGSMGIKTPYDYLPPDIVEAIKQRTGIDNILKIDDRLATDNEVKYICANIQSYLSTENALLCKLMAKQLGEASCTRLYDALYSLINETRLFQIASGWTVSLYKKETACSPTGIELIRNLMHDTCSTSSNVEQFERIFFIVLSRPLLDKTRTRATKSVYDGIRNLLSPTGDGDEFEAVVNKVEEEWKQLFRESKAITASLVY